MTLQISLTPEAATRLRERAAEAGQPLDAYVACLVEQAATRPTLEELLAPVRRDFAEGGLSEDDIMTLGRSELAALRAEKKTGPQ